MTVLALILIVAAAAVWIILPLAPADAAPAPAPESDELPARRRELLLALQDLDFELQTGKLSAEDHGALRARLEAEAVDVLRRIEAGGRGAGQAGRARTG